jgi:hypothetical protein
MELIIRSTVSLRAKRLRDAHLPLSPERRKALPVFAPGRKKRNRRLQLAADESRPIYSIYRREETANAGRQASGCDTLPGGVAGK